MTALRAMVREALDNSQANGFNPHDERDVDLLVQSLCDLDADLEKIEPKLIEPHVIEWLTEKG